MKDIQDESTWPVWANEKIEIVDSDPNWVLKGAQEKARLLALLSSFGINEIQHYGSTSIPNLPAKPIIDLMTKVDTFKQIEELASILESDGWNYVPPHLDGRTWQRFFVKVVNNKRVAHLHILIEGDERWDKHILFRDLLRNNQQFIEDYAILKRSLAKKYNNDREAYTKAKNEFITYVLDTN
ncbi:GrpB family protein [Halalkalibacter okhensis]|uniref:GrpB family protein n=1 Tax=Halalkalibacter okhensis TaxID=333138 RepID=A0A0B0IEK0_9BACI|nr:GrpB family protein [Halalkalibacter okhensis]KHF39287.1 hypothetical protein LQ50_16445 [Halalkalibacter okhensis]